MSDDITTLFQLGLGPWLTPLKGKLPLYDAWPTLPPVDEPTVRGWIAKGLNVGLRTGVRSGVIVIDDDRKKHGLSAYDAPPTGFVVATSSGGRHYYYRAPADCPGNSSKRFDLPPHVDVRGEGGQCVVPPSIHPVTGAAYSFVSVGEPGPWALKPKPKTKPKPTTSQSKPAVGYADTALAREVHAVRTASEGERNNTLNSAAFSLGQLVGGGELDRSRVEADLLGAALLIGLPEREATATIASGLKAGLANPRKAPTRPERPHGAPKAPADVLIPGAHVMPTGEYVEQGCHTFCEQTLKAINPEALYRRADLLGEIRDGLFNPVNENRLRGIVDASVHLIVSKPAKDPDQPPQIAYRSCTYDNAALLHAYALSGSHVRNLNHLATYPVCVGRDFDLAKPGWNPDHGVYLVGSVPEPLDLATSRAVLDDLLADFPFQAQADKANFIGLMLTPILRPAIDEPVPMYLICSPMERTGKTKLAEIVLGVCITGKRTPAMQLTDKQDEQEKRLLSVLLHGQSLIHLDNLSEFIDSPALASLLTSSEYQGRILGSSVMTSIPNTLTVVGTGNNVHATGEIAKRIVPIRLLPATEAPDERADFKHPKLFEYVTAERDRVLAACFGLIEHWRANGRPQRFGGFGGFEKLHAVVGGILDICGIPGWLTNRKEWLGEVDDSGSEYTELITAWSREFAPSTWVDAQNLYDLAVRLKLFGWLERSKSEHGKRISFGTRVLTRLHRRVIAVDGVRYRVEVDGVGSRRQGRIVVL